MLKVKDIALADARYGGGYECIVNFQVGEHAYNNVKVKLPPEATREVVNLAIARAAAVLVVVGTDVLVEGEPLPLIDEAPAPEFAEVDEAPAPSPVPTPLAMEEF